MKHAIHPRNVRALLTFAMLALILAATNAPANAQTYTVVYNFGSRSGDPMNPWHPGIIAQGHDGRLFSATTYGGDWGDGAAFKITPTGELTVLHSFNGTDGQWAQSGLTLGTDGNYYGTTVSGGLNSYGTIFKITPGGTLTTLYNFTGGVDGGVPGAPPIQAYDGNFYGTTSVGGSVGNNGTVYRITPSGAFTTLHSFGFTRHSDDNNPPLVQGTDGYLYGNTLWGGMHGLGVIFRISTSGAYRTLLAFGFTSGGVPYGPLTEGSDGNFYGITHTGRLGGEGGAVFKVTPTGTFTALQDLGEDCGSFGGLVQATDGSIYGTCLSGGSLGAGVIFSINSLGEFADVHDFDWYSGGNPVDTLLQQTNGKLYGMTWNGGTAGGSGGWVFYSLDMGLGPFVRFLPEARAIGHTIQFLGQSFTGTTAVSFNGTPATFKVVSDTYLTAVVPSGATTGFVTVTTPTGALKSNKKFQVRPHTFSFSPASGPVGTAVIIKGDSLKQTTVVKFDGVTATSFTVDSNWQVTATVPSGAKTGKISITTTGAPTYTSTTFTVTP